MRKFTTTEFEDFLRRVDAELTLPCTIVLIGGGAIGLKYKGSHATADLDLWSVSENGFWLAVTRVNAAAIEKVPVQKAPIAEPPYSFEDRLIALELEGLSKLNSSRSPLLTAHSSGSVIRPKAEVPQGRMITSRRLEPSREDGLLLPQASASPPCLSIVPHDGRASTCRARPVPGTRC